MSNTIAAQLIQRLFSHYVGDQPTAEPIATFKNGQVIQKPFQPYKVVKSETIPIETELSKCVEQLEKFLQKYNTTLEQILNSFCVVRASKKFITFSICTA